MITNKKLLIDEDCPMCGFYGAAFTKMGLIDNCTLYPYQTVEDVLHEKIDMNRARNAIAFYGESGTVYGIDAFIEIISQGSPFAKAVLTFPLLYYPLIVVYNIISYNRKLIYPVRCAPGKTCIPDVHVTYRWIYIVLVAVFTGLILNIFFSRVTEAIGYTHHPYLEWLMCFGQILWQGIAILILKKEKAMDYLGNMSSVSMIGGGLVLLILVVGSFMPMTPWAYLATFGAVVAVMLTEHVRRCKLLHLSIKLTISWLAFRTLFLVIILYQIGLI